MAGTPPTIPPLTAPEFRMTISADVPTLEVTDRLRMVGAGGKELRWVHRSKGWKLEGSPRAVHMAEFAALLEMRVRLQPDSSDLTVAGLSNGVEVIAAMRWALGERAHLVEVTAEVWNQLHDTTGDERDDERAVPGDAPGGVAGEVSGDVQGDLFPANPASPASK